MPFYAYFMQEGRLQISPKFRPEKPLRNEACERILRKPFSEKERWHTREGMPPYDNPKLIVRNELFNNGTGQVPVVLVEQEVVEFVVQSFNFAVSQRSIGSLV